MAQMFIHLILILVHINKMFQTPFLNFNVFFCYYYYHFLVLDTRDNRGNIMTLSIIENYKKKKYRNSKHFIIIFYFTFESFGLKWSPFFNHPLSESWLNISKFRNLKIFYKYNYVTLFTQDGNKNLQVYYYYSFEIFFFHHFQK